MTKAKRVALYGRVSNGSQSAENQLLELGSVAQRHGWRVVAEFVDHAVSGDKGRRHRARFDAPGQGVARREYDMVAAWSVDRLGRSLQDLVAFQSDLQSKKVDLYLHQQALDTSRPSGKVMFGMLAAFAEFERTIIQERVRAGLARARAKGKALGRPRTAPEVEARIRDLAAQGMGKIRIARTHGIAVSVTQRVLA